MDQFYFGSLHQLNLEWWQQGEVNKIMKKGVFEFWQHRKLAILAQNERWTPEATAWRMDVPDWPA